MAVAANFVTVCRPNPQQIPVEQPTALFLNEPAHTIFIHVGIMARPVAENVIIIYICFPTGETGELPAIWPRDSSREGTPASLGGPGAREHSRVPNVHLQAGLLPNQVAHCPMGQAIDQKV